MAAQVRISAQNQLDKTLQDWMTEEDLKSLPRATKVNSLIFVRHLTETSFELNVNAPDNADITRHILVDMEGGRRFYEPGECIRIRVEPYHRGEGYEFHIVDIDNYGRVLEHLTFQVDTKFGI